jgi:hypothetical protein
VAHQPRAGLPVEHSRTQRSWRGVPR